jgi:hypothetical protein
MTLLERDVKVTRFTARDENGTEYRWAFWYDQGYRAWFLRDCEGYERRVADTWIDSVPRIRTILHNYGMTATIS